MVKLNSKGVNWIKNLPCSAAILNEGAREELGWKSLFEIYYGRKSNAILNGQTESLSNNEMHVTKTMLPNKKDIAKHWQHLLHLRKQAKISGQWVDQHTQNRYKKPKTYTKNEKVFVRLSSGQGKEAPRRRLVCQGKVLKKMKNDNMYKVLFFPPFEKEPKISWFSIEAGLEKLDFLVHESPCSSKQVQENVARLKILFTLWLFEVQVFTSLCSSSCTKWNILWKDESVQ